MIAFSWATRPAATTVLDGDRLATLEDKLDEVLNALALPNNVSNEDLRSDFDFHTKRDAELLISDLGTDPKAEQLAQALAIIDTWIAIPEESEQLQEFKIAQIVALRHTVQREVRALHAQALKSKTGSEAAGHHSKASQVLALFPMDTTETVLDEARKLSLQHAEVGSRLDVIRRQRYNAWAMGQIEETIKSINAIASSFSTADNPKTIEATVRGLGEIDP
jgi:hypothetical protein